MSTRTRAFTLIELLLVIAILAAIIGVLIVSMRGVRLAANRTESSNALRQMITGYNSYSNENRQTLMPGYVDAGMIGNGPNQIDLKPRRHDGGYFDPGDISSYVWRLAPYLDHQWHTMMVDYRNTSLVSRLDGEVSPTDGASPPAYGPESVGPDQLGVASVPSFGLNSIFVGGDSRHGGPDVRQNHPFSPQDPGFQHRIAATRFSEVRNPTQLIVFGPVAEADVGNPDPPYKAPVRGSYMGYPELRPPFVVTTGEVDNWRNWSKKQWEIGGIEGVALAATFGNGFVNGGGLPIVRWGGRHYPVGHLDGSTAVDDLGLIANDMRRWSPFVTGLDFVTGP